MRKRESSFRALLLASHLLCALALGGHALYSSGGPPKTARLHRPVGESLFPQTASELTFAAQVILDLTKQTGGATYNLSLGRGNLAYSKTPMWAVSVFKDKEKKFSGLPTSDEVEAYLRENRALLEEPQYSIGVWVDNNVTHLDISWTTPDERLATQLGIKHQQQAIFDLKNMKAKALPSLSR